MGAFYGSVHVRTGETADLRRVLEELATDGKTRFLMGRPASGWTAVYPSGSGQDFAISAAIAARLAGPVIHLLVHDDDLFAYRLYDAGGVIDEYDSNPDYFQPSPPARWKETEGRPEALAALGAGVDIAELTRILSRDSTEADPFRATSQMARVAARLGIANVETSYEYVQAGEVEGIKGWKQFVHVPDLTAEKEAKRRRKAEVARAMLRLQREGRLLLTGKPPARGIGIPPRPVLCTDPRGGFLLAWGKFGANSDKALEWWQPPWREPSETGLRISSNVYKMSTSRRGRFLAVGHGSGEWSTALFDLHDRRLVRTVRLQRATEHVSFTPDERTLICRSEDKMRLVSTGEDDKTGTIAVGPGRTAAVHPEGRWLVADVWGNQSPPSVTIVDLEKMRVVSVLRTAQTDVAAWMAAHAKGEKAESGFHPQEVPRRVDFTPDGRMVVLAVEQGVRIYSWDEVRAARSGLPAPLFSGETDLVAVRSGWMRSTHTFAVDARRGRVLYGGLDGHVRALDFRSGQTTVVFEIPGTPPIVEMAIGEDGDTLATVAHPGLFHRGAKPPAPVWHVWNLDSAARAGR
jgi:hypothetical protein